MTTPAQTTLLHAAELLEADAKSWGELLEADLQNSDWKDEPELHAAYADIITTALELRLLAKRINDGQIAVSPTLPKGE